MCCAPSFVSRRGEYPRRNVLLLPRPSHGIEQRLPPAPDRGGVGGGARARRRGARRLDESFDAPSRIVRHAEQPVVVGYPVVAGDVHEGRKNVQEDGRRLLPGPARIRPRISERVKAMHHEARKRDDVGVDMVVVLLHADREPVPVR